MKTDQKIIISKLFDKLPKVIKDTIFEYNVEHRYQMKHVLNQLITCIFCENCNGLIYPSLINKVSCCSSVCMYQLMDDYKYR